MKKRKNSGSWGKRLASSSLAAVLLVSSAVPVNVFADSFREELKNKFNEIAASERENLYSDELQIELSENPIRDGVDITSDEYQSLIIQFNSMPLIEAEAQNNGISSYSLEDGIYEEHNKFTELLSSISKERGTGYSVKRSYYNTFNGVAVDVKGTDIEKLLESGIIKAVWKDETATIEPETVSEASYNGAPASRMVSSTPLIGVDKLREEGITGEGVKVGVLDTGVDYNHPDITENFKGGYDFVDNDSDPMETTYADWQNSGQDEYYYESTYYTSHGTHVSGTIAATGSNTESEFAVTGIAPEVDLYVYRVLGPYGMGSTADILAGIEQSVEDGMDVINLSLGVSSADPLYPTSVACNNAALAGTIPVVANGNAGPDFSTLGSPGTSPLSISVGASSTAINLETFNIAVSDGSNINSRLVAKNYNGLNEFTNKELELVYGGFGYSYELADLDVSGKVLLIDRGEITFAEKLANAKNAGAAALIIANNVENSELNVYVGEAVDTVHCVGITMEDGQALKDAITSAQENLKVEFTVNGEVSTEADILADFSSRGPSSDETIKPDVVAPGVSIFSTFPEYINSPEEGIDYSSAYSRISGTSMASPHVAGIVALMLQNNPEISASDAKVALMNTCDELASDYPINAMGAGRVNAYRAVHSDMAFKVLDKTNTLNDNEEEVEIDYVTGSLSYDRLRKSEADTEKTMEIAVDNNSGSDKEFNVSVRYLGSTESANDAAANGVEVKVPASININNGESITLEAAVCIPAAAEVGRYEGYVTFTNADDSSEEYKVPFSATYVVPGIESIEISRPAVSNDLEMMHFAKISGATATVSVSSPLKSVEVYVKDYDSKEVIGYIGTADFSYVPGGSSLSFYALDSRASYFPMKNGKVIENIKSSLTDGKYILEFVGKDIETEDVYTIEKNVLIDNEDAQMTFDYKPGVYEINDSMYSVEDYFGNDYEAFWVHGNVTDNSVSLLQEMGYNTTASDIIISGFVNGMPNLALDVSENGDFKFGIEKSDLDYGQVYEFSPMPIDVATSQNLYKQPRYFFIKEGAPYTSVTLDKNSMKINDKITATVSTHNLAAGSTFNMSLSYAKGFELMSLKINDDLQKVLDENNYTAKINKSISGTGIKELTIDVSIEDKAGNPVDISGTMGIIDAELKLTCDNESEFYREYVQCSSIQVLDKEGNYADMAFSATYEGVDIVPESSRIYAVQLGEGFSESIEIESYNEELDQYLWVEDNEGNKYNLTFDSNMQMYTGINLPVSQDEYKLITALPGHFKKTAKFVPSRTIDGETISKVYYLMGSEYYRYIAAGDVNGDGLIDMLDALEVEKYYGQNADYKENPVDFNFDGVVNEHDMDYIAANFGQYNEQVAEGEPVLTYEGRTLDSILEDTGYNTANRLQGLTLDQSSISLEIGESSALSVTFEPVDYEGEVKWKSFCEDIAKVDENGIVTAVNSGTTYVRATADNGQAAVYCFVTVTKDGNIIEVESATADEMKYEMKVGEEQELEFMVNPDDAVVKSVQYVSAADSIVTVEDGKAIAKSPGTTIVTADINSGMAKVTWEITVVEADDAGTTGEEPENPGDSGNSGDSDNPGNSDEGQDNPHQPGNSDGSNDNNNSGNSGNNSSDKNDNTVVSKPNDKMPLTGGRATLPVVILAAGIIAVGAKLKKRK